MLNRTLKTATQKLQQYPLKNIPNINFKIPQPYLHPNLHYNSKNFSLFDNSRPTNLQGSNLQYSLLDNYKPENPEGLESSFASVQMLKDQEFLIDSGITDSYLDRVTLNKYIDENLITIPDYIKPRITFTAHPNNHKLPKFFDENGKERPITLWEEIKYYYDQLPNLMKDWKYLEKRVKSFEQWTGFDNDRHWQERSGIFLYSYLRQRIALLEGYNQLDQIDKNANFMVNGVLEKMKKICFQLENKFNQNIDVYLEDDFLLDEIEWISSDLNQLETLGYINPIPLFDFKGIDAHYRISSSDLKTPEGRAKIKERLKELKMIEKTFGRLPISKLIIAECTSIGELHQAQAIINSIGFDRNIFSIPLIEGYMDYNQLAEMVQYAGAHGQEIMIACSDTLREIEYPLLHTMLCDLYELISDWNEQNPNNTITVFEGRGSTPHRKGSNTKSRSSTILQGINHKFTVQGIQQTAFISDKFFRDNYIDDVIFSKRVTRQKVKEAREFFKILHEDVTSKQVKIQKDPHYTELFKKDVIIKSLKDGKFAGSRASKGIAGLLEADAVSSLRQNVRSIETKMKEVNNQESELSLQLKNSVQLSKNEIAKLKHDIDILHFEQSQYLGDEIFFENDIYEISEEMQRLKQQIVPYEMQNNLLQSIIDKNTETLKLTTNETEAKKIRKQIEDATNDIIKNSLKFEEISLEFEKNHYEYLGNFFKMQSESLNNKINELTQKQNSISSMLDSLSSSSNDKRDSLTVDLEKNQIEIMHLYGRLNISLKLLRAIAEAHVYIENGFTPSMLYWNDLSKKTKDMLHEGIKNENWLINDFVNHYTMLYQTCDMEKARNLILDDTLYDKFETGYKSFQNLLYDMHFNKQMETFDIPTHNLINPKDLSYLYMKNHHKYSPNFSLDRDFNGFGYSTIQNNFSDAIPKNNTKQIDRDILQML